MTMESVLTSAGWETKLIKDKDNLNTIGVHKHFPTAGSIVATRVGETTSFNGTHHGKIRLEGKPVRVRARLTQRSYTGAIAYTQTGNSVVVSYTGAASSVGDKVFVFASTKTTGDLKPGWRIVTAVSPGVSITYQTPPEDSQSATGQCYYFHPSKNWRIAVALTEQPLNDTQANAFIPQRGGTQYNVLKDPTVATNLYGWNILNWPTDENDPMSPPDAYGDCPAGANPSDYFLEWTPNFSMASDWIDLPDVPPTDGSGRYLMLYRAEHDATTGGDFSILSATELANYASGTYDNPNDAWYRPMFTQFDQGKYGIATLTDMPATPVIGPGLYIQWEVDYGKPVENWAGFGDSTLAFGTYWNLISGVPTSSSFSGYLNQAVLGKSTPDKPYTLYNGGMGSHKMNSYIGQLKLALNAGYIPDGVVIQSFSVNDSGSPTEYHFNRAKRLVLEAITLCRKAGVRKILVPTWPYTESLFNNPTNKALIDAHNLWVKQLSIRGISDGCPDFVTVQLRMGLPLFFSADGVTPSPTAVGGVTPDRIHPGPAGTTALANELKKYI